VLLNDARVAIPTALLSASMVPYATVSLGIGAISWILPWKITNKLDTLLYRSFLRLTLFVFENVSAVKLHFYGDIEEIEREKETAIVISNHQTNVDWAVINMLAARQSPQGSESSLRFVMKYAIHFVPLFGWYVFQRGYVYVRRRKRSFVPETALRQLRFLVGLNEPFWVHIFPEGTRFNRQRKASAIEESQRLCAEKNMPILHHVLLPRTNGFALLLNELRCTLGYVYDVTIGYGQTRIPGKEGSAPNMLEFCCGEMEHKTLHVHVKRYAIETIPTNSEEQRKWLVERFQEKDALMSKFYKDGVFPDLVEANANRISLFRTVGPFLAFTCALAMPFYFPEIRKTYIFTITLSPLLIGYLHMRRYV
jgi:1-acyl-sn-glycerol-3-phosphate acyltransferase